MTETEFIALVTAIASIVTTVVSAIVFIRTGKVITTTDATHELVNGQSARILEAARTAATAAGYAAGIAAAPLPAAVVATLPAAAADPAAQDPSGADS